MLKSLIKRIDPDLVRLYAYFLPHKGKLLLSVLFLVASASTSSVTATLLGKLTDLGFYKEAEWVIYAAPAALMAMTLVYTVSDSVLTLVYREYKHKFLWWRWGTKGYKVKVVNFNPHATIRYNQYIKVE